jgi:HlyD family secretion protein
MKPKLSIAIVAIAVFAAAMTIPNRVTREVHAESASAAGPAERMIAGAGRIEPVSEEIQVGAELYGRIHSVLVEEGQLIRQGHTIAVLVNDDYLARVELAEATIRERQASVDRLANGARSEHRLESEAQAREAEAILANALADRERRTKLFQAELISRMEFDASEREFEVAKARSSAAKERAAAVRDETRPEDLRKARAELDRAHAQLAEAKAMLAKTYVTAPIDGTVLRKQMKAGESITALSNQPVITMGDCSRLRVRVDVDETDVGRIQVGQEAWVRADAYGAAKFKGRVLRIGQTLGRKKVRTDEPGEKVDQKVLETLIEMEAGVRLPIGLRVDAYIKPGGRPTS